MRDILTASENWARAAHHGLLQDDHPTYEHLLDVVSKLHEVDTVANRLPSEDTVAAAWLHDSIKYTRTTAWEIGKTLNRRIADIVQLMADPGNTARNGDTYDADRALSKALAYRQFAACPDASVRREAGLLRCVDRFCNQKTALASYRTGKIRTYVAEFPDHLRIYGATLLDPAYPHRIQLWNQLLAQYGEMRVVLSNAAES